MGFPGACTQARKLMLTGIMVFVERDSSIQIAIGCLINFGMLMISLRIQPIFDPLIDAANNIALLELYLTLFLGLLFRVSAVSDDAGESELFTVVVAFLAAFIFVYPMVGMLLFSRRARTTVKPPKSPLVKAALGYFKPATKPSDAAPADTVDDSKPTAADPMTPDPPKTATAEKNKQPVSPDIATTSPRGAAVDVESNPTYEATIAL